MKKEVNVYNVLFFNKKEELIDQTQIDEKSEELAWDLFKEFGHTRQEGDYLEFDYQGKEIVEFPRPDSCEIEKRKEILKISINNTWYEVHVDSTEQRVVEEIFPEHGEVTSEITKMIDEMVAKMDN